MNLYSVWSDKDGYSFTLCEGTFPKRFVNGDPDPDCHTRICKFPARDWTEATKVYSKILNRVRG